MRKSRDPRFFLFGDRQKQSGPLDQNGKPPTRQRLGEFFGGGPFVLSSTENKLFSIQLFVFFGEKFPFNHFFSLFSIVMRKTLKKAGENYHEPGKRWRLCDFHNTGPFEARLVIIGLTFSCWKSPWGVPVGSWWKRLAVQSRHACQRLSKITSQKEGGGPHFLGGLVEIVILRQAKIPSDFQKFLLRQRAEFCQGRAK